ncbi:cobalamin-binding protein [Leptolyngbya sp. CCNP1308]|uniref:cobalamin-binding protein n=1 Tax=Leptolyngbya sp. CCNP1308 TaxID=3110255 RepID=UPI002B1F2530|nr:cobalamin-binding protein [Leptolyngbya sp. CCNP1308]MEA5447461.1 cobalamin-binding protein [Leptolyngbya sp. CCNP1308]
MTQPPLRIISLIPSATEIVCSLGLEEFLVGRSHECDFPPAVKALPVCTAPKFNPEGTSGEIHQRVSDLLTSALSVYRVDIEMLEALQPTHIITQAQCEVCAVSLGDVEAALAELTQGQPQLISLSPNRLADVWDDIYKTGVALLGKAGQAQGEAVLAGLKQRVQTCRDRTINLPSPTVACIEWTEPLMAAGNWVPELVDMAGGKSLFGQVGQHSPWMAWGDLVAADPEVIVIMPCGYDLAVTRRESAALTAHPQWSQLKAVKTGRVYLTDGNQYFNRPGPRLVDSLEILAEIFYPERVAYGYQGQGWQPFSSGPD